MPIIVLGKGFEKSIVGKDVRRRKIVIEDENRMADVAMGRGNADELDGNKIGVDGGDGGGEELSLDLVKLRH